MTSDWAKIPYEVLDKVSIRIVNEVKGVNRIVYDVTSNHLQLLSGNRSTMNNLGEHCKKLQCFVFK